MDQRGSSAPLDGPLERLRSELSRLRATAGDDPNKDAVISRLLEALRQIGEELAPLAGGGTSAPSPQMGPVLAFRRGRREADESEAKGPVVLVIEPEPSVNDYLRSLLLGSGFDPVSFSSAEEAIERARAFPPDAVTIDEMVLRHGKENWLVRFKTDPALVQIPLVLIRAPEEDDAVHSFGIAAEVTKPIVGNALVAALRKLCAMDRKSDSALEHPEEPPPGLRVVRG